MFLCGTIFLWVPSFTFFLFNNKTEEFLHIFYKICLIATSSHTQSDETSNYLKCIASHYLSPPFALFSEQRGIWATEKSKVIFKMRIFIAFAFFWMLNLPEDRSCIEGSYRIF